MSKGVESLLVKKIAMLLVIRDVDSLLEYVVSDLGVGVAFIFLLFFLFPGPPILYTVGIYHPQVTELYILSNCAF